MCTTAFLIGPRILLGNGNVSLTHVLDLGSWEESNGLGAKFSAS
jgi:V8-like Glu-specific endopeptidase